MRSQPVGAQTPKSDHLSISDHGQKLDDPRRGVVESRRITLLCARYWPDRHGGVEQRLSHISREIARAGQRVCVLTENRTGSPSWEMLGPSLSVRRLDRLDPGPMWRWIEWPRLRWWYRAVRRWADPGVVWATDSVMAAAALLAGRGRDLVYNPAACIEGMRRVGALYPHVTTMNQPRRLRWLDRWAYRHAPRVVVSSGNLASQFSRYYGDRSGVHVVPHGVELPGARVDPIAARRSWGIDPGAFVVGFVGRLDPCKGLDFLFQAVSRARVRNRVKVLIVGEGSDRARLETVAASCGVGDQIVWTGAVHQPDRAYAAMDCLVLASVYEAFGNVLLEAMAHGVVTIGRAGDDDSVMTSSIEIIDHGVTGVVVDPHDEIDLARALDRLADDRELTRRLGVNACRAVSGRSWRHVAWDYLEIVRAGGIAATRVAEPQADAA